MAYWTASDLSAAMGPRAFVQCCDDDGDGTADTDIVANLLADSTAIVNGYVTRLYSVAALTASTPTIVKQWTVSIAADLAYRRRPEFMVDGKTPAALGYAEAMRMLREVAKGAFRLDVAGVPSTPANVVASYRTGTADNDDPVSFVKDGTGAGGF